MVTGIRWLTTITFNGLHAAVVLLSTLAPLVAQAPPNLPSRLQEIMRDFDAEGFSGVVLVEQQGTIEFLQAYGYADRRRKIRNTPETRFEMASLTKPFTAAAILKLQEQGRLRTSDRIDRYIGPLKPPKNLATIHNLARRSSRSCPGRPTMTIFVVKFCFRWDYGKLISGASWCPALRSAIRSRRTIPRLFRAPPVPRGITAQVA